LETSRFGDELGAQPALHIVNADDGLKLWVSGVRLIDDWGYTPYTRYAKLRLAAKQRYAIKLELIKAISRFA
jgi:hypothetical protein